MKRFALLLAVVLVFASQASAAPGDSELTAWQARWMDADFRLHMRYNPNIFDSYAVEERAARIELYVIQVTYPGTSAAFQCELLINAWGLLPRSGGIRDTSYFP